MELSTSAGGIALFSSVTGSQAHHRVCTGSGSVV